MLRVFRLDNNKQSFSFLEFMSFHIILAFRNHTTCLLRSMKSTKHLLIIGKRDICHRRRSLHIGVTGNITIMSFN